MGTAFVEAWSLHISTLGPVHIGSGDEYEPTGYVMAGDTLYAFDSASAARALPAAERQRLLSIVNGRPGPGMLRQVQAFFHDNRERLIAVSGHALPVARGVSALYGARVGHTAQVEDDGREILNRLAIARTYTNPSDGRPVMLGSAMKGAIRTALLSAVNGGGGLSDGERKALQDSRPWKQSQANRDLQLRLFRYASPKGSPMFERDPMRLVHVSDAPYGLGEELPGTEIRFAVNRKKERLIREGQEVLSQAERQDLKQVLEVVPPLRFRAFLGQMNLQAVAQEAADTKVPARDLRWSMADIVRACNQFYRPKLEQELQTLRGRGFLDPQWAEAVEAALNDGLGARLTQGEAFLLRMGRHSGAEAVTVDGSGLPHIKIMRKRGEQPEYLPSAKTVWLSAEEADDRNALLPMGWVVVDVAPLGSGPEPWANGATPFAAYSERLVDWSEKTAHRRKAAAQRFEEEKRRLAEKAEKARREAEETRQREQRRAEMTPEERDLDELRTWLQEDKEGGRKEPGGRLSNRVVELLKVAQQEWNSETSRQLAELAEEIYAYLGWPASKKKKQARRAEIDALKKKGE